MNDNKPDLADNVILFPKKESEHSDIPVWTLDEYLQFLNEENSRNIHNINFLIKEIQTLQKAFSVIFIIAIGILLLLLSNALT